MLDRVALGVLPEKPHTVFRAAADGPLAGALLQEEMFTRGGFDGPYSYLYHQRPITAPIEVAASPRGFPVARPSEEGNHPLRRRLYHAPKAARRGPMLEARTSVVVNSDVALYVLRPDRDDDVLFANGDGDELFYVFEGELELESVFGRQRCVAGDYVHVPRSTIHRWKLLTATAELIVFECAAGA